MSTHAHKTLYQARHLPTRNDPHKVSTQPRTRTNLCPPLPPPAWDRGGLIRREGSIAGGFIGSRLLFLDSNTDAHARRARQARTMRSTSSILRRRLYPRPLLRRATNSRATPTTPTLWYPSSLWVYNLSDR